MQFNRRLAANSHAVVALLGTALSGAVFSGLASAQITYTVNQTPGAGDFTQIQPAMAIATNGDTVLVTDTGIYQEVVDFDGEDIVLECDPLNRATIEPPPAGITSYLIDMSGGLSRQGTLRGFRVRFATNGAILCSGSSPTIDSNQIINNTQVPSSFESAGITGVDASPLIVANDISGNTVNHDGGGILLVGDRDSGDLTQIVDNTFDGNDARNLDPFGLPIGIPAERGGAIHARGSDEGQELAQLFILRNDFSGNNARGFGGAISIEGRPAVIQENDFSGNNMLFEPSDVQPCGQESTWGGGAISFVDCDYGLTLALNNTYFQNTSDYHGGGVYAVQSLVRFAYESMTRCFSVCIGGGIYLGQGTGSSIVSSEVSVDNFSGSGGGVAYDHAGTSVMIDTTIANNGASEAGAGIYSIATSPVLRDNLIDGNGSGSGFSQPPIRGGGLAFILDRPQVERCEIIRNEAAGFGGGIYAESVDGDFMVLNCIIGANVVCDEPKLLVPGLGGAMYASFLDDGATLFASNTVARNRAEGDGFPGIYIDSATVFDVVNGIVWNNKDQYDCFTNMDTPSSTNRTILNPILGASSITVSYTDIVNNAANTYTPGVGNIQAIPRFRSWPTQDFRIKMNSPCINQGTNSAALISGSDIELQTRIRNGVIDMGADEDQIENAGPGTKVP